MVHSVSYAQGGKRVHDFSCRDEEASIYLVARGQTITMHTYKRQLIWIYISLYYDYWFELGKAGAGPITRTIT